MERAQGMTIAGEQRRASQRKNRLLIAIIILFHAVGLAGTAIPATRELFLKLVPFHLLLMLVVIAASHKVFNGKFALFVLVIFLAGFIAEYIGVHTGLLFGDYVYGDTLGFQLDEIPLMIGVNWFLLVYATGVFMQRSRLSSMAARVITGAIILVFLDLLIEPVATRLDYWYWADGIIPVKNYTCWLLVSAFLLFVFEKFKFEKQSAVAPVLLLTQFLFFIGLHFL